MDVLAVERVVLWWGGLRRSVSGWRLARGVLGMGAMLSGAGEVAAEPTVEVRRAVALTVRLGEPVQPSAAGAGVTTGGSFGEEAGEGEAGGVDGDEVAAAVAVGDALQTDLRTAKRVVLSLEAGVLYDDNIFLDARDRQADLMWWVGGEGRLNYGDAVVREASHVVLRYRPVAYFFLDNTDENSVDHEAALWARKKFARLAVDAAGTYQRTSGSTMELGDRVERDEVSARAGLSYDLGVKSRVGTAVNWNATAYREGRYADYSEWGHEGFADYQMTGKFRFGLGGGFGRLDVDDGSEAQDVQRAVARVNYAATGKVTVDGRAGMEFRQTEVGDTNTPVFGLDARYEVSAKTTVQLQGVQEVMASGALEGQNYVRTGLSLGVSHRLNDRLAVSLNGGWERYDYERASRAAQDLGDREDTSVFVRPGFTYTFGDRWMAEAWYQWRSADSSDPDQVYDVNQAGLNLRCTF